MTNSVCLCHLGLCFWRWLVCCAHLHLTSQAFFFHGDGTVYTSQQIISLCIPCTKYTESQKILSGFERWFVLVASTVGHTEFRFVLFQTPTHCRFRATGLSHCIAGLSTAIALTLNIPRGVLWGPPLVCYWLTSVEINKHKIFDTNNAWITEL